MSGKKTFTGGINTKSQTVSGTTDLNDDILFGVVKVVGSGNIRLPSPIDNAGGRILTVSCLHRLGFSLARLHQVVQDYLLQ